MEPRIKKIYFSYIVALILCIAFLNTLAYIFHWYWKIWWFDIIMHTLGGLWIGSFSLWYFFNRWRGELLPVQKSSAFLISIFSALIIGVGWEMFEFSIDTFIAFSHHDPVDTSSDIFFDVLGSTLAVLVFLFMYNKNKE